MSDAVNHPAHYTHGQIEPIEVIEDWDLGFCEGNAVKYIARARHKGEELTDLKKARWYLDRRIEQLEGEEEDVLPGDPVTFFDALAGPDARVTQTPMRQSGPGEYSAQLPDGSVVKGFLDAVEFEDQEVSRELFDLCRRLKPKEGYNWKPDDATGALIGVTNGCFAATHLVERAIEEDLLGWDHTQERSWLKLTARGERLCAMPAAPTKAAGAPAMLKRAALKHIDRRALTPAQQILAALVPGKVYCFGAQADVIAGEHSNGEHFLEAPRDALEFCLAAGCLRPYDDMSDRTHVALTEEGAALGRQFREAVGG
jgi:hypothetical protein